MRCRRAVGRVRKARRGASTRAWSPRCRPPSGVVWPGNAPPWSDRTGGLAEMGRHLWRGTCGNAAQKGGESVNGHGSGGAPHREVHTPHARDTHPRSRTDWLARAPWARWREGCAGRGSGRRLPTRGRRCRRAAPPGLPRRCADRGRRAGQPRRRTRRVDRPLWTRPGLDAAASWPGPHSLPRPPSPCPCQCAAGTGWAGCARRGGARA